MAEDSGPGTEESQLGGGPEVRYWMQGEDGLKVTAAGLASEEEVQEEVQHVWQEGLPGGQDQQVLSAEQCKSMVEAMRHESLTRQRQEKAPSGFPVMTRELGDEPEEQECRLEGNCPATVWRDAQEEAARTLVAVQECERLWKEVSALMLDRADPREVQKTADAALELTAQCWQCEPSHAVDAVITKMERRTPLTFAHPEMGTLVRYASASEQQWKDITTQLWKDVKAQQKATTGSSGYTKAVTGVFGSMREAEQALREHDAVRKANKCPLRNRSVESTVQGTAAELEELLEEMLTARREGIKETNQVVMDESGDTYEGAFCYTVAYKENIGTVWEQLVSSWRNSQGAVQEGNGTSRRLQQESSTEWHQQCRHWYQPGQGQVQQPCQWMKEHPGRATIKVQGAEMIVQRWRVAPMELEASKELEMEHQGRVPAGCFVFDAGGEGSHHSASQEKPVRSQGTEHVGPVSCGGRSRVQAVPQRTVEAASTGQGSSGNTGGARPHRRSMGGTVGEGQPRGAFR